MPEECAVKVFKTTLNEFKTRDRYIKDDHRFKDRFSKQNPRKIIRLWAEKEMCNLSRLVLCWWLTSSSFLLWIFLSADCCWVCRSRSKILNRLVRGNFTTLDWVEGRAAGQDGYLGYVLLWETFVVSLVTFILAKSEKSENSPGAWPLIFTYK